MWRLSGCCTCFSCSSLYTCTTCFIFCTSQSIMGLWLRIDQHLLQNQSVKAYSKFRQFFVIELVVDPLPLRLKTVNKSYCVHKWLTFRSVKCSSSWLFTQVKLKQHVCFLPYRWSLIAQSHPTWPSQRPPRSLASGQTAGPTLCLDWDSHQNSNSQRSGPSPSAVCWAPGWNSSQEFQYAI